MSYRYENRRNPVAWVVAADRAHAKFFSANWPELDSVKVIAEMHNPEGQMQGRELRTDAPTRDRAVFGPGHAISEQTDHRHATAMDFADQIVSRLEQGRNENEFGHVVLIAPSLVLGEIRNRLSGPLQKLLQADIDKEIVHLSDDVILGHARQAVENVVV